ncbi:MAG: cation transporter [Erysipelotrichales bacterium]|nr:cation transporter [Erysipelotrichales bacterium]
MTEWLVKLYIKDHENVTSGSVREQYGKLSSCVGILCNVALFLVKLAMGILSGSIAIISDAFNNLSDSVSNIVAFISYKLAAQPADKDHPFGHGRIEYLASLVIAAMILLVGFEFLKSSIQRIITPQPVEYHSIVMVALVVSVIVKVWLWAFNRKLGERIDSSVMLATATDSLSDAMTTTVTALSLFASLFTEVAIDGFVGVFVSCMILKAGYEIIKDTVDSLIGRPVDKTIVEQMMEIVNSYEVVLGMHDLIVHNYGPNKLLASFHVEIRSDVDLLFAHDQIDLIENEIKEKLQIMSVIHMDPIDCNNEEMNAIKTFLNTVLQEIDPKLSLHDLHMAVKDSGTELLFDVLLPHSVKVPTKKIETHVNEKLQEMYPGYVAKIIFDISYFDEVK